MTTLSTRSQMFERYSQTHIEIIMHDHHRRVTTCALALNLDDGEFSIFGGLPRLDAAEVTARGVENVCRPPKHTWCCCADLDKVFANGFAICPKNEGEREESKKRRRKRTG